MEFGTHTWTGLAELVEAWFDGSVANHGLALRIASAGIAHKAFQSREGNVKPQLIIEYLPPKQDIPSLTTGDTHCQYGERDCNVCVQDVRTAYDALNTGRRDSHVFRFDPSVTGTDRIRLNQHIQGMARIPGLANDNWIVFSKHDQNEPHQAGLVLVEYPAINSDGDAWKHAERTSDRGDAQHFFTNADTDHPGGMQITGKVLAVGMDCDSDPICSERAWVDFYDLAQADHGVVTQLHRLVLDGSRGEAHQFPPGAVPSDEKASKAHYVSVVKLASGHFLLFVVGAKDNRGWFYVTDSSNLNADTTWTYLQYWHASHTMPSGRWSTYQNGNFITECSTGDIYFFGMKEALGRRNHLDLYRLEREEQFRFHWVARKVVWNRFGGCSLRGGGSVHVTPDRNEIVLYCIEKNQRHGPNMTLEEFRDH
jgi:hypothetical protein